jgi:hypothetical protein
VEIYILKGGVSIKNPKKHNPNVYFMSFFYFSSKKKKPNIVFLEKQNVFLSFITDLNPKTAGSPNFLFHNKQQQKCIIISTIVFFFPSRFRFIKNKTKIKCLLPLWMKKNQKQFQKNHMKV